MLRNMIRRTACMDSSGQFPTWDVVSEVSILEQHLHKTKRQRDVVPAPLSEDQAWYKKPVYGLHHNVYCRHRLRQEGRVARLMA